MAREKLEVEVLDDAVLLPLDDLARICGVETSWVEQLVAHGVVAMHDPREAAFSVVAISRLRKARRLEQTFDLPPQGLALVMELLDELDRLKALAPHLRQATEDQH